MSTTVLERSSRPNSIWSRLLRRDRTRFVGIDIGVDQVHVASIGGPSMGGPGDDPDRPCESLPWLSRSQFALPVDPASPPGADLVEIVCETLGECLPRCVDGERHIAAIAIPPSWIHYQTTPLAEIAQIQSSCNAMFGNSVFQSRARLNHWPVCDGSSQHVFAATAEQASCRVAQTIAGIGFQVQSILPHGAALLHAAQELTALPPSVVVLLQSFGGLVATSNHGRCGMCRSLPAPDLADGKVERVERIEAWLGSVAQEIIATVRYVDRLSGHFPVNGPVLLCGDVAQIPGVDEALANLLQLPVATWQYSKQIRPRGAPGSTPAITADDCSRALALSLAYCAADNHLAGSR